MRALCCLVVGSLLLAGVPLSAQTHIVHINRRGPTNVGLVDLNSATKDELMTLPSVGAAEAERIIKARPFQSKRHLLDDKIVSLEVYEKIEKRVTTIAPPPKG